MNIRCLTHKFLLILIAGLTLSVTGNAFAAPMYRVSTQFFHLGELIGQPVLEFEEGQTAAGSYSAQGFGQYTIAVLVHPIAENQLYVSLQFSSGNIEIQPNLMVDIGQPRSATVDKIRLNLLVEEIGKEKLEIPEFPVQTLNQNTVASVPKFP